MGIVCQLRGTPAVVNSSPVKDERLKFRVLQILKNRTPSPAPGTSSPPPSPADPCSCADEQCCWRWTLLAVLSDIWAISHIEPGLVDFSHQSDRSTGSNLPASTAGKVVLGRSMRRRSHPTANYPHRRGAGDAAALQEPQEGLPGSRIARRPSCSPFGKAVLMRLTLSIPRRVRRPSRREAPTSRAMATSDSTASWIMRRALA